MRSGPAILRSGDRDPETLVLALGLLDECRIMELAAVTVHKGLPLTCMKCQERITHLIPFFISRQFPNPYMSLSRCKIHVLRAILSSYYHIPAPYAMYSSVAESVGV